VVVIRSCGRSPFRERPAVPGVAEVANRLLNPKLLTTCRASEGEPTDRRPPQSLTAA
jgi:hypothetical protein